jgi:5-methylcytosine-specific restriction endonuclease McrA
LYYRMRANEWFDKSVVPYFAEPDHPMLPRGIKRWVMARDGWACVHHCGSLLRLAIDHKVPRWLYSDNHPDQLQTLCLSYNTRKGGRYPWPS